MQPIRFYFVRHGQTYSNLRHMAIGGGGSAPLTASGRKSARLLGLGLRDIELTAAYSSPVARAQQTARLILSGRKTPLELVEGLRDVNWGDLEGATLAELNDMRQKFSEDVRFPFGSWWDEDYLSKFNGETSHDFAERFEKAVLSLVERHRNTGGNILVVSHAMMTNFFEKISGNSYNEVENTSVTVVVFEDGAFHLEYINDMSKLKKGKEIAKNAGPIVFTVVTDMETAYESRGLLQGHSDSSLTKNGILQAHELKSKLCETVYNAVYCSPLGRSRQLCDILTEGNMLTVQTDKRLAEMFFAHLEVEEISVIQKTNTADAIFNGGVDLLRYNPSDEGERGISAACRMDSFFTEIAEKYAYTGAHILVFTHKVALRSFAAYRMLEIEIGLQRSIQLFYQDERFYCS